MASVKPVVRRALLYVPGSSKRMMEKTRNMNVDCVAYDLEDSVTESKKVEARASVCNFLQEGQTMGGVREVAVRINSTGSGLAEDDLTAVLKVPFLNSILVPKVNSASDLAFVTNLIEHWRPLRHSKSLAAGPLDLPPISILALIESAKAVSNLSSICKASPYLSGLIFAAEDFALDLSLTRTPSLSEFLYARSAMVTECRAHGLPSAIDLVCTAYKGPEGQRALEEECVGGKGMGFNGKQCIHPSQVDITQKAFAPSGEELSWATRILVAGSKADSEGRGAFTLDGKMIDTPVIGKAKGLVVRAQACGLDTEAVREQWQHQEPE